MSEENPGRARVLDPIERASEAIFGVLMAVSITGSISSSVSGRSPTRARPTNSSRQPFLRDFIRDAALAMRVSNALAIGILYAYGQLLGRHAGGRPWRYGLFIAALGVGLVAIIKALGG
jgi:hypothetical protein